MENVTYLDDWRRAAKLALDNNVVDLTERLRDTPKESLLNLINDIPRAIEDTRE